MLPMSAYAALVVETYDINTTANELEDCIYIENVIHSIGF